MQMTQNKDVKRRAIVYIDGFNLYFGIRDKNWYNLMWLDQVKLARELVRPDQELLCVKYFTSRIKNDPEKQQRQNAYLDALDTLRPFLEIYYGEYRDESFICRQCGKNHRQSHEKQTDVNIATHMLVDAFSDRVDDIILITADSDQCPAMNAVREAKKHVLIVLPPGRGDYLEVQFAADNKLELTAKKLRASLLPSELRRADGFLIECPRKYRSVS